MNRSGLEAEVDRIWEGIEEEEGTLSYVVCQKPAPDELARLVEAKTKSLEKIKQEEEKKREAEARFLPPESTTHQTVLH